MAPASTPAAKGALPRSPPSEPQYEDLNDLDAVPTPSAAHLSPEAKKYLKESRTVSRSTTASARRTVKVAEDTRQLAAATLEALYHQRGQLENINRNAEEMEVHVKESETILSYLRRCLVCFPCCDGDPDRKARKNWREKDKEKEKEKAERSKAGSLNQLDDEAMGSRGNGAVAEPAAAASGAAGPQLTRSTTYGRSRGPGSRSGAWQSGATAEIPQASNSNSPVPSREGSTGAASGFGESESARPQGGGKRSSGRKTESGLTSSSSTAPPSRTGSAPSGYAVRLPRLPEARTLVVVTDSVVEGERQVQAAALDQLSETLRDITSMARDMTGELDRQAPLMDAADTRVEGVRARLHGVNQHSKLRKFKAKSDKND